MINLGYIVGQCVRNWPNLKVIYHPIYGMNNYVLIWGDWLSCDPLITPYKETLVPHLVATLIYLSQMYSYYIRGDRSPLSQIWRRFMIADL